jgi:hypothetical protein
MKTSERSVVKIRLKDILRNKEDMAVLEHFVRRMNVLCTHVYQFLRLWILGLEDVPEIDEEVFHMCFKALTAGESQAGPKPKDDNAYYFEQFQAFCEETYSKLNYERLDATNLSAISSYAFIQMKTALENNIKSHYTNHVRRFINKSFECGSTPKKEFYKQLAAVKRDVFNHTLESPEQFHRWIRKHGKRIVPEDFSIPDLYENPQDYLPCMIYMSRKMEKKGLKQFQFFPQRTSLIPKHITLDTKALIEIFSEQKGKDLKRVNEIKDIVWGEIFKTNNKVFRRKNHTFDHMITTNGYEASILFIPNEQYDDTQQKRTARTKAAKEAKQLYKGKTREEVDEIKEERKESKKKDKKPAVPSKKCKSEFNYLEDATDQEKQEFKTHNYGLIDMGKIRIITMLNNANEKIFKHTRRDELQQTKRLSIAHKTQRLRRLFISDLEQRLSKYSSKTCKVKKYSKYIKARNKVLVELSDLYAVPQFRRLQFHLYINRTRTKAKLVGKIRSFLADVATSKSKYSIQTNIEPILVFGNWSANKNMKHMVSTPGVGLKRFLLKHFKSYDIDEFRTSIIHHKTEERCENLYLNHEKIHSVLTYKMEHNRLGCINRDRNAIFGMKKITTSILETGEYPYIYRRTTPPTTAVNPPKNTSNRSVK